MKSLKVPSAVTRPAIIGPAVIGLIAAASLVPVGPANSSTLLPAAKRPAKLAGADLVAYSNCSQLLRQVKAEALKEVGPYGVTGLSGGPYGFGVVGPVVRGSTAPAVPVPTATGAPAASSGTSGSSTPGYSTTNDQEAGVDEPDIVKTDGQVMVVLRQDPLGVQVVDVTGSAPKLDGFLALPQLASSDGLFLVGQDVYVIGSGTPSPLPVRYVGGTKPPVVGPRPVRAPLPVARPTAVPAIARPVLPWGATALSTEVVVVSLANPESPSVARTFLFQGADQGARLINGQVVLALADGPRLPWAYPASSTPAAQKAATAANKALVESSTASDWLPSESVRSRRGGIFFDRDEERLVRPGIPHRHRFGARDGLGRHAGPVVQRAGQ